MNGFTFMEASPYLTDGLSELNTYQGQSLITEESDLYEACLKKLVNQKLKKQIIALLKPISTQEKEQVRQIIENDLQQSWQNKLDLSTTTSPQSNIAPEGICPSCGYRNPIGFMYCENCERPLT